MSQGIRYTHEEFDALPKWQKEHLMKEWKMKVLKYYTIFLP